MVNKESIENYIEILDNLKNVTKKDLITKEILYAGIIVLLNRIIVEIEEIKTNFSKEIKANEYDIFLLGAQLETVKHEIEKIRTDHTL